MPLLALALSAAVLPALAGDFPTEKTLRDRAKAWVEKNGGKAPR